MSTIKTFDQYTQENANFYPVVNKDDGTPVTDADCDGVIYRKFKNGTYGKRAFTGSIQVEWFGAKGDDITDDTAAFNKAMLFLSKVGGGIIKCRPGKIYKINGTILISTNITLDLNNSTLDGTLTTDLINTAYLSGNNLITNIGTPNETELVQNSHIINGKIANAGKGLNLFNFITQSTVRNILFTDCVQSIYARRCFYNIYENIISIGAGGSSTQYTYDFADSINACSFIRCTATKEYCFSFAGGCTAINIISPTCEGGTNAFLFSDDCLAFTIQGGYFEAVKDVFNFLNLHYGYFDIIGNYINITDRILANADVMTGSLFGNFDVTNVVVNVGYVLNGFTYRGLVDVSGNGVFLNVKYRESNDNTELPANYIYGGKSNIQSIGYITYSSQSDVRAVNKRYYGILPVRRAGDTGPGMPTGIAECAIAQIGSLTYSLTVTTKITFQSLTSFTKFLFKINTISTIYKLYGETYGDVITRQDAVSSLTITTSNSGGMLMFTITGFNETANDYTITGDVQLQG